MKFPVIQEIVGRQINVVIIMRAILCVVFANWSAGALADWQYTRWGMSVDQVVAASGGQARRFHDPGKNSDRSKVLAMAPYSGAGMTFSAYFRFDNSSGLLSGVDLSPSDPELCNEMIGKLKNTYGEGADLTRDQLMNVHKWYDRARGNVLSVVRIGFQRTSLCTLGYQPYQEPGAKGGL